MRGSWAVLCTVLLAWPWLASGEPEALAEVAVRFWGNPLPRGSRGYSETPHSYPEALAGMTGLGKPGRPALSHSLLAARPAWLHSALRRGLHLNVSRVRPPTPNGTLHVVILGGSVTAGCGFSGRVCAARGSWGDQFGSQLLEKLRAERTASGGRAGVHRVDVDIYARNAVNADYFRLCPERFGVRPTTGVILLDMEPAMGMSGELHAQAQASEVLGVMLPLRRIAPRALLGFVGWPALGLNSMPMGTLMAEEDALAAGLAAGGAMAAAFAAPALAAATGGPDASATQLNGKGRPGRAARAPWFADDVHPNQAGHLLMAELAGMMVARQLHPASRGHRSDGGDALPPPPPASEGAGSAGRVSVCHLEPQTMPVERAGGFKVEIDRWARKAKNVTKQGLESRAVNDTLWLGPIAASVSCGLVEVALGYLQSWDPAMGSFDIRCVGCECQQMPGVWSKGAYPFPRVQAWTSANTSLTMFTRFLVFKQERPCRLSVTHVATNAHELRRSVAHNAVPPPRAPPRVRIDALGVELTSAETHCALTQRPWSKSWGSKVRGACLQGTREGRPGYFSPEAFNASGKCKDARLHPDFYTSG